MSSHTAVRPKILIFDSSPSRISLIEALRFETLLKVRSLYDRFII